MICIYHFLKELYGKYQPWSNQRIGIKEMQYMNYQYSNQSITESIISLKGEWYLIMSSYEEKEGKNIYKITLPASITEKGFGEKNEKRELFFLSEKYKYVGKVVFEKTFDLPDIHNKSVSFFMERSRITKVWVNGIYAGRRDLLTTQQYYDITELVREGRNTISVEVDNTYETAPKEAIIGSHMATEHTQTNWIGILGEIGLRISSRIYPYIIRVYPYAAEYKAKVRIQLISHICGNERVRITLNQANAEKEKAVQEEFTVEMGNNSLEMELNLDKKTPLWSEFEPFMTSIVVNIETSEGVIEKEVKFGLRDYKVGNDKKHIAVNGKNIFIRSETNCAVFPETGYAPMDEESWDKLFDTYLEYGINYVRFHSWCPPDAAFRSADKKGLYIQPELCEWTFHTFEDLNEYDYYMREAKAIVDFYGNHPSFVALTWGNELRSQNRKRMGELCHIMRDYDDTRLYAEGSNAWYGQEGINEDSDFVLAQGNYDDAWRGTFAGNRGFINDKAPAKNMNYSKEIAGIDKPVISFEVGQFQVYPDYDEIKKYKGPLEARNLTEYQKIMIQNGLAGKDKEFHIASGKLAMMCYREEIEAAMRTPDLAGISLLGLQDFSGQGTALVGMIDAFGEPKKFADPAEFRSFFGPVTPLVVMDKHSFYSKEYTELKVYVHNFGKDHLHEKVSLTAVDLANENRILYQEWIPKEIIQGKLNYIGSVQLIMPTTEVAVEIEIRVSVGDRVNKYKIFVYPNDEITAEEKNCIISKLDQEAIERLNRGESLLYNPKLTPDSLPASIPASYISDFWCWIMFKKWDCSGTMGLTLDPESPIFNKFPTDNCTDPRWWHLLSGSRAVVLTRSNIEPLIQMIDNIQRNEKLAMAFEVNVGKGKLLVTSLNLSDSNEPTVKAFTKSLLAYINSDKFNPSVTLSPEELMELVPGERNCIIDENTTAYAGINAERAVNALTESNKAWDTVGLVNKEDAFYQIDFHSMKVLDTIQIEFAKSDIYGTDGIEFDLPGKITVLYRSDEGWKPVDIVFRNEINNSAENIIHFKKVKTDSIRIVFGDDDKDGVKVAAISVFGYQPFAITKINLY